MARAGCEEPLPKPQQTSAGPVGAGHLGWEALICLLSSCLWQSEFWGPQQGPWHAGPTPIAVGPGCAWDSGLCLLWEAGGSSASPAHTARSVLGPERGNGWGAALPGGSRRLEQAGGPGPWLPDWDSSEGPVIYSCSSVSHHLVGKSFLGKWGRRKRKQGEVPRAEVGQLLWSQAPLLQASALPPVSLGLDPTGAKLSPSWYSQQVSRP